MKKLTNCSPSTKKRITSSDTFVPYFYQLRTKKNDNNTNNNDTTFQFTNDDKLTIIVEATNLIYIFIQATTITRFFHLNNASRKI